MGLSSFIDFLRECSLIEEESAYCKARNLPQGSPQP